MENERDWQGKTQGNIGIKLLFWFFKIFPLSIGYFLLWFVIPFYIVFARKGYKSIYYYFRYRLKLPPLKAFFKTFSNHYIFGQILLDRAALFAGKKNVFKFTVEGNETLTKLIDEGKGAIILSSHIGNFEIAGYLFNMGNTKMYGLIYGGENPNWQKFRNEILNRNNIYPIPISTDLSHIFTLSKAIKEGNYVGMPGDRSFLGTRVQSCCFLDKPASFPTGAFLMAEKLKVPILAFFVMKSSTFSYKIYIKEIKAENTPQKVERFVNEIETRLKEYPEQWFNFYDFWNDMNTQTTHEQK